MTLPILATKLHIPLPRPQIVHRKHLIERLNAGLYQNQGFNRKLTLISAPAGFGKTTLTSEWIQALQGVVSPKTVAWLSLDAGDDDLARFLTYFVAALQVFSPTLGAGVLGMLQTPQPPPIESILIALLNVIATIPNDFILVLDDYHLIDSLPVDEALAFLLEHLPPQMHLVIATREDPQLPLARYRARGQLIELRAADLRFTSAEAAEFLNQVMNLNLSTEDIAALETRTEGWIAGLQLASLAMQGHRDVSGFIQTFTGSHHFVLDYLLEEVLSQQPEHIQAFLLRTSILDQLCGPLCDAVCSIGTELTNPALSGQEILEHLQQANLFIIPLDDERRWYRYHHLFADLLRQRLQQHIALSNENEGIGLAEYHLRASQWYEDNDLDIEAFQHAVAANDFERTARLVEGDWMPLQFRGAVTPVLNWLSSLSKAELDARPLLWVMYASALSMTGQINGVEEKLQAAETAIQGTELDEMNRNIIGHAAAIRALLAAAQFQVETIISESQRALEYLHPDNLAVRTATVWKMGIAYQLQGNRSAASKAYTDAISICEATGNTIINISATTGLGLVQESENRLYLAAETYQRALDLIGDSSSPLAGEAYLGLARIHYQWNDLKTAQQFGEQSAQLARQVENWDRLAGSEIFLANLRLSQGDVSEAALRLTSADQIVGQHNIGHRISEVATTQVRLLLHQGSLEAAAAIAKKVKLPICQARVYLAQGEPSSALAILESISQQMEARGWQDEQLKVMILLALSLDADDQNDAAKQLLHDVLIFAEPEGFIRIFVDAGTPMSKLLTRVKASPEGVRLKAYLNRLLSAFREHEIYPFESRPQALVEPLSERELEVLQLIAQGLSNREISERLHLALSTVKGHNRNIYGKLQVQRRTEAVACARELGLV
jgi:LuxR family transcriptional regulator, maltose regulon positive regulatory protein